MRTPRLARQGLAEAQLFSRAGLLDTIEQAVIATELDGTLTYWWFTVRFPLEA